MKNKNLFDKTVSILVKAYQNDTLIQGHQCGCAVGNLVAANMGIQLRLSEIDNYYINDTYGFWYNKAHVLFDIGGEHEAGMREIELTGYSVFEVLRIEKAFERGEDNFNGLMAVVDCLQQIHEATPQEAESAKLQFVRV